MKFNKDERGTSMMETYELHLFFQNISYKKLRS